MSGKAVEPVVRIVPTIMSDAEKASLRDQFDRQIANATTLDELFDKPKPLGLEDIAGTPVDVLAVRFVEGREEYNKNPGALGVFMVMEFDQGKGPQVLTTGAATPVKILYKIAELGGLPIRLRFYTNRTGSGQDAWDVERV